MTTTDPTTVSDAHGRRVCATLHPSLNDNDRAELCIDAVGYHVQLAFRYPQAGRLSMRGTVERLGVLCGPSITRPVLIMLTDGGAHVISLAAIASWDRLA